MTVSICACGHPWPSHTTRKYGLDYTKDQMEKGETVCKYCMCYGYLDALEVEDRYPFRVAQKVPRGNTGSGHPLMVALANTEEDVAWAKLSCYDCGDALTPQTAIVRDSAFYCGECFITHPEVYCG